MEEKLSREELRIRLRNKIANIKKQREHPKVSKKQLNSYANKLKQITSTIDKYELSTDTDKLPAQLVEEIKGIISEEDTKNLIEYLKQNNTSKLNNSMINFLNDIEF